MPEYLAPGVFVEEIAFRNKSIEGAGTSSAGFVGPCRSGPIGGELEPLTSTSDFERIYGTSNPLQFGDTTGPVLNYLAHAVRAFFKEGGRKCYVARIVNGSPDKGSDGNQPCPADYEGVETLIDGVKTKTGLRSFEDLDDISIVATPGATFDFDGVGGNFHAEAITQILISHCEQMRYRVAVIDSVNGHDTGKVRAYRSTFDSKYAALYYPWIGSVDPLTGKNIEVPPSGSVCGIYARVDRERGVHKAPANEEIRLASGMEFDINRQQQSILNPLGINCLRYFKSRGYRVWGARTASSDPEWKYINVRRYFAYLEHSIDRGTQWTVFENNAAALWNKVRQSIEDFLFNEWRQGHLAGTRPEEAYSVRCDRSTMTQGDIDNGRLICDIGVAPVRPAEFVILRIARTTAVQ
jgi:phage tail sheath protein FI